MAFSASPPEIDRELALKTAFTNRSDYRNAIIDIKNAETEIKICKNDRLPSLAAELNAQSYAYDSSVTDALTDTSEAKYPTYSAPK
jgi:outer membrane protein TolC